MHGVISMYSKVFILCGVCVVEYVHYGTFSRIAHVVWSIAFAIQVGQHSMCSKHVVDYVKYV